MVFLELFVSDTLTMVNSIGLLEDEDTQISSPGALRQDKSYDGEDSFESIPEGDKEDSDGYNDAEEVRLTYRESSYGPLDISLTHRRIRGPFLGGVEILGRGVRIQIWCGSVFAKNRHFVPNQARTFFYPKNRGPFLPKKQTRTFFTQKTENLFYPKKHMSEYYH